MISGIHFSCLKKKTNLNLLSCFMLWFESCMDYMYVQLDCPAQTKCFSAHIYFSRVKYYKAFTLPMVELKGIF